jgi:hypothetical protein
MKWSKNLDKKAQIWSSLLEGNHYVRKSSSHRSTQVHAAESEESDLEEDFLLDDVSDTIGTHIARAEPPVELCYAGAVLANPEFPGGLQDLLEMLGQAAPVGADVNAAAQV